MHVVIKPAESLIRSRPAPVLPALALLANASIWGLAWLPFKALESHGLHPLWTTTAVFTGALLVLALARPSSLRDFAHHPQLLFLAVAAGLTNVGFTWAITIGDVVRVTLLFYLMPVWSIGLAWLLLRERPTRAAFVRLVLALAGVLLVLRRPESALPLPQGLADYLGLFGGFCFALNNVLVRRLRHTPETGRAAAMFVGGFCMAGAFALVVAPASVWPLQVAWAPWVAGLSIAFLASNLALQYGAARLPANATALIMLSEILIATMSSSLLGAAHPTPSVWVGGTLIVLAALLAVRRDG